MSGGIEGKAVGDSLAVGSSAISIGPGEAVTRASDSSIRSGMAGPQAATSNIQATSQAKGCTILGHDRIFLWLLGTRPWQREGSFIT